MFMVRRQMSGCPRDPDSKVDSQILEDPKPETVWLSISPFSSLTLATSQGLTDCLEIGETDLAPWTSLTNHIVWSHPATAKPAAAPPNSRPTTVSPVLPFLIFLGGTPRQSYMAHLFLPFPVSSQFPFPSPLIGVLWLG